MKLSFRAPLLAMMVSLLFLLGTTAFSQENQGTFDPIDQLLNYGETQQALQLLHELPEPSPGKLWRLSRVQYEMGRMAESKSQRLDFFRQAEKYARATIVMAPNNSEGFKWLAISLGAQSKYSTTKEQINLSQEIKNNIEKSLALNPDDDISYLVLSRWNYKISALGLLSRVVVKIVYGGLPEASLDKAEELLWKAIKLHDRVTHRYNLAKVYYRMGRRKDAIKQLHRALSLPATFPAEIDELCKAQKKLQKWQ